MNKEQMLTVMGTLAAQIDRLESRVESATRRAVEAERVGAANAHRVSRQQARMDRWRVGRKTSASEIERLKAALELEQRRVQRLSDIAAEIDRLTSGGGGSYPDFVPLSDGEALEFGPDGLVFDPLQNGRSVSLWDALFTRADRAVPPLDMSGLTDGAPAIEGGV